MSWGERLVLRGGLVLCVVGLLLVLFVVYQLWGTALYENEAQSHLRSELSSKLHRPVPASAAPTTRGGSSSQNEPASSAGLPPLASGPAPPEPDPPINAPVGLLSIPSIGVSFTIVEGVGAAQLEQGPGHYPGTPLPGEPGNAAVAGHRTTYAHPFYDLTNLHKGDAIYVLTPQGRFKYTVVGSQVVAPTDTAILDSTSSAPTLTLTTCNPRYEASSRLVVTADFTAGGTTTTSPSTTTPPAARTVGHDSSSKQRSDDALGSAESYWPGALWGLATLALYLVLRRLWRRSPRGLRWLSVVAGLPLVAGGLLMCFERISLALPGSV